MFKKELCLGYHSSVVMSVDHMDLIEKLQLWGP